MANQRLDATITIGSVLERSVRKNLNLLRRGLDGVGDEIKAITDRQRELSKQRKVLERQGQSVDDLDREYEQLGRTLDDLRRKQERFERAQGAANRVGRQFQSTIGTIGRQARGAGVAMGAIGTAAVAVTETTATAAREIRLFSQLAGAGETEFQRFAAGAKSVGIENDKLSDILKDTNDRIGDFVQTGGGPMADFFEKIGPLVGVTVDDFKELSGPQALQLYVSSLEKANLSQADMTFYMEAMASDSTALIPLLQDNGKAMREIGDEAERTGQIMSKEALDAAEKYRREMGRAGGALTGVRNIIGEQLMPVIGDLAREFTTFVTENRPQIEAFAETLAGGLRDAVPVIGEVVSGLGDFAGKVGSVVSKVAEMIGGWDNFGIALGVLMTSPAIVAVGGFVVTVGKLAGALGMLVAPAITAGLPVVAAGFKAIGAALLANPIGVAVAAIAGGALLVITNWEKIKPAIQPVLDWIGGAIDAVQENAIRPFISLMSDGLSGIAGAWQGVRDAIGGVLDWITEKFSTVMDKIKPVIDALTWVRDQGAGAVGAVTGFFGGDAGPSGGSAGRTDARAVGGALAANVPTLVGERGPELIYPNQGGFVAHHRAVERLAQLSAQARTGIGAANENAVPNIGRLASEVGSIGRAVAAAAGAMVATSMSPSPAHAAPQIVPVMQQVAPVQMLDFTPPQSEPLSMPQPVVRSGDTIQNQGARSASVVQNITINAPQNMDVQQLVAALERLKSLAQNDALFDGANDWGQYA